MKTNQRTLAMTVLCLAAVSLSLVWLREDVDAGKLLKAARQDLRAGRFQSAEEKSIRAVTHDESLVDAFLVAGEAAAKQGQFEKSVTYYRSGAELETRPSQKAKFYFFAAESCVQIGRLAEAETYYKAALLASPDQMLAEDRLEFVYRTEGRISESVAVLERRTVSDTASVEQLLNFGHPNRDRKFPKELLRFMPQLEEDGLPMLALARESLLEGDLKLAEVRLKRVVAQFPESADAQTELGQLLLDRDEQEFVKWFERLPPSCRESASIWLVRGLWAERHSLWPEAAVGFLNCLTAEPFNRSALFHLAIALGESGNPDDAASCRDRSRKMEMIERILDDIHDEKQTQGNVLKLIPLLHSVGRSAEARNWLRHAKTYFRDAPELRTIAAELSADSSHSQSWLTTIQRLRTGLATSPVPRLLSIAATGNPATSNDGIASRIEFRSASKEVGLEFEFVNLPETRSHRKMVQSNGGGIGVVDIDNDGWPDLYFTQGGSWPSSTPPTGPSDQLFRNFGGKVFRNATESSGLVDCNFGQGVTVGDLNGDGFDEIYVANVGGNRLFQNNGDGTLSDISVESELAGNEWSTSCAMNDFNLDGHLDLYVVNYLSFDDAATEICHEGDKLRSCRTEGFEAAEDRLYLNGGDGSFMDVSVSSGVQQPNGRGLGIITADFDGDHYPDVFVGNDAVPNFLFLNRSDFRDTSHTAAVQSLSGNAPASELDQGIVRFEELAVQRGIATDDSGRSQACMGVAFADFDLDRHDDIFVTNFYNEPNTLYLGQTDGMFIDRTRSFQLSSPSIPMLGFGTQALDADLDGDQDLVVLNGHLDDLSAKGVPFQMQPQVFENQAGKWFVERQLDCPFFRAQHIGRSLARLDWNNDGREDLATGLLGEPYELLTNVSQTFGGWVGLQLVGTTTSRNAPGAIVTIHNGEASTSRQLASGSGFQASNQHRLMIAIRDKPEDNAVKISIRWANGEECVLNDVSINQTYFVVQPRTQTSLPLRAFALPM